MNHRPYQQRWRLVLLLLIVYLVCDSHIGTAHALLIRSNPAAGALLSTTPAVIELWFSEPLESRFSRAYLVDAAGNELGGDSSTVDAADPTHMTLSPPPLTPANYTVVWHTVSSADGHEWTGSFPITLLNPDGSPPAQVGALNPQFTAQGQVPAAAAIIIRWLSLAGALLFFGVAALHPTWRTVVAESAGQWQNVVERGHDWALLVAAVGLIAAGWQQLVLQADQLGNPALVGTLLLYSRAGQLMLVRQVAVTGLLLTGVLVRFWQPAGKPLIGRRAENWLAILGGLLILGTFSLSSHAAAVVGSGWAMIVDFVHLAAAALWLGGLWLLAAFSWHYRRQLWSSTSGASAWPLLQRLLLRFSAIATITVGCLLLTGLFSSLVQLSAWHQLWSTVYGRLLLLKVALTAMTLTIAWRNHVAVGRFATSGGGDNDMYTHAVGRGFVRRLSFESISGVLLLLVVAALVQTPHELPTPATPAAPGLFETIVTADDLNIHLQIAPNQVGDNAYIAHLYHEDGSAIGEVQLVRLSFTHQTADLGQATLNLDAQRGDIFRGQGAYLNHAGAWDIGIYVRRRGMDDLLTVTTVIVPDPGAGEQPSPWQNPLPGLRR